MIGEKPKGVRAHLPLAYPALMLGIFFIIPFGIMVAISFFHRQPGGFYIPGFEFTNYKNLYTVLFGRTLLFSLFVAGLSAAVCVSLGFPFTYFITRMRRRTQVIWLVFLMSVLSLSEVIIGFAWSLILSRTAGLSNLFVWLGLMEQPKAWYPGFTALLFGICYLNGQVEDLLSIHRSDSKKNSSSYCLTFLPSHLLTLLSSYLLIFCLLSPSTSNGENQGAFGPLFFSFFAFFSPIRHIQGSKRPGWSPYLGTGKK